MKVTVMVKRRPMISDPQGSTVGRALRDLGYKEVTRVRIDKVVTLEVEGADRAEVESRVAEMCRKLLANPVMEDFEIEVHG